MLSDEIQIRVRYCEVDRMGYLHHGNYAVYFEEGRTELIRKLGLTYREMEDQGILLPVRELYIKYFKPALYDDKITIQTTLAGNPSTRLEFEYKMLNSRGELLSEAKTTLVFVDAQSRKPIRIPEFFEKLIAPYFNS